MWFMSSGSFHVYSRVSLNWQIVFAFCKNIRKYLNVICDKNRLSQTSRINRKYSNQPPPPSHWLPPAHTLLWLVRFLHCVTSGKQSRVVIGRRVCPVVRALRNEDRSQLGAVRCGMPCLRWGRQPSGRPALLVSLFSCYLILDGLKLNTETRLGPIL